MTVEVTLLIVIAVLLIALVVITVLFLTTLQKMADANDRTHERWDGLLRSNLDRMMAPDFNSFKAYALAETASAGGVEYGPEEEYEPQTVPDGVHTLRELLTDSGGGGGSAA